MKCSESWLRTWVNPTLTQEELCNTLTMAGLEVESFSPVASFFTNVIVGEVITVKKHPAADNLHLCEVKVNENELLNIVCGAANVRPGIKVPVAIVGATLPNNKNIVPTTIRGMESQGMLCSASELGLTEDNEGLLELSAEAPIGIDLCDYLELNDYIIDIAITPNRSDCLSVQGIAREISALTGAPFTKVNIPSVSAVCKDTLPIDLQAGKECPNYIGRVIRGINQNVATPVLIKERLRRSGIRSISPVVDVTNYVMLELGQPMHAFDLQKIEQGIQIRLSQQGEKIALLDGSEQTLDNETLVIADQHTPLAIAGVMGGLSSSVTLETRSIFLESAFFSPSVIARQRQYYGLNSDSAYRFERGVDPMLQREAMERATQLILEITGGESGPIIEVSSKDFFPPIITISLSEEKIRQVLGISIPPEKVEAIFKALAFTFTRQKNFWIVRIPSYRFDITLPEDLIEEIARLYGYDNIPTHTLKGILQTNQTMEGEPDLFSIRKALVHQGYHEIISYSFIDKKLQKFFDPEEVAYELVNPITTEMTVMRTNLWPGLINALIYNANHQQHRIRLFELGTCFLTRHEQILQQNKLGGLITGLAHPEQWGLAARQVDFYDLKNDIQNLLSPLVLQFEVDSHPALHPGQTASIYYQNQKIGILGAIHPTLLQELDLANIFVFELDVAIFQHKVVPQFQEISKFPEIRRDIAILVNQAIPAQAIQDTIKDVVGDWLKEVFIFDVYQGKGIANGLKSVAIALILKHPTRTLIDNEVTALMERVILMLKGQFGAELRS